MKPCRVGLCLGIVGDVCHGSRQADLADCQTVGSRLAGKVFQRQEPAGSWHVLDDDGWMPRHVASEGLSHRPRVQIIGAAG